MNNKTSKRVKISELELHTRAKKGSNIMKKIKSFDYKILIALITNSRDNIILNVDGDLKMIKGSDIPIMDLSSTGSNIAKSNILNAFVPATYETYKETDDIQEKEEIQEDVQEEKKEIEQTSLDDFYQDFKL